MGKRNKGYYIKSARGGKKGKYEQLLQGGMKGFLITCGNKAERDVKREAYSLFNEYADKMYGPEKSDENNTSEEEDEDEDIEKALKKEVENIKKTKSTARRFQAVDAGANNVVFIKTTLDNPIELLTPIITDLKTTRVAKSRHIMKMFPVIASCKSDEVHIKKTAINCLKPIFEGVGPFSYSFIFKIRNHTGMNKGKVLPVLCEVFDEMNLEATVKYQDPDYIISIDIIKSVCCFSVLKDFSKYRKYNLQEIVNEKKPSGNENNQDENDERIESSELDQVAESSTSKQVKEIDEQMEEKDGNTFEKDKDEIESDLKLHETDDVENGKESKFLKIQEEAVEKSQMKKMDTEGNKNTKIEIKEESVKIINETERDAVDIK